MWLVKNSISPHSLSYLPWCFDVVERGAKDRDCSSCQFEFLGDFWANELVKRVIGQCENGL